MWGLIKGGAQVGGRQHIEKDKVAQTEWDGILGKAQVGLLLPPTALFNWLYSSRLWHVQATLFQLTQSPPLTDALVLSGGPGDVG